VFCASNAQAARAVGQRVCSPNCRPALLGSPTLGLGPSPDHQQTPSGQLRLSPDRRRIPLMPGSGHGSGPPDADLHSKERSETQNLAYTVESSKPSTPQMNRVLWPGSIGFPYKVVMSLQPTEPCLGSGSEED
jgi:hypothetical protein